MAEMTKDEIKNITPVKKEVAPKPNYKYMRDKDREMVKGIFRYHEVPGGAFEFVYKAYKGDEVERYLLVDGCVYTIPLGVAKHLNNNVWYPQYDYVPGENLIGAVTNTTPHGGHVGKLMRITKKVRRVSFQSLEFLDVEGVPTNTPGIVMVEAANI